MKKQSISWAVAAVVVIIIIIAGVWWYQNYEKGPAGTTGATGSSSYVSPVVNSKVSSSLSQFKNEELGFSVNYPSDWQTETAPAGVTFIIPDQFPETTIGTLEALIQVLPGDCAFPPVVTVKSQGTTAIGSLTFNTMSIQNSVEGRDYYNDFYSLQKGSVCYMFTFESVTLDPTTKGFSTSDVPKIDANNQVQITAADTAFKAVVSSFAFIAPAVGQPETSYHPAATSTAK